MTKEYDQRSWGNYTVLDEGKSFKVKRIEVALGKRLGYRSHRRRSEHWFGGGTVKVTLNDRDIIVKTGAAVDTRVGDRRHRVANLGAKKLLVFIETQIGDYFGRTA